MTEVLKISTRGRQEVIGSHAPYGPRDENREEGMAEDLNMIHASSNEFDSIIPYAVYNYKNRLRNPDPASFPYSPGI